MHNNKTLLLVPSNLIIMKDELHLTLFDKILSSSLYVGEEEDVSLSSNNKYFFLGDDRCPFLLTLQKLCEELGLARGASSI